MLIACSSSAVVVPKGVKREKLDFFPPVRRWHEINSEERQRTMWLLLFTRQLWEGKKWELTFLRASTQTGMVQNTMGFLADKASRAISNQGNWGTWGLLRLPLHCPHCLPSGGKCWMALKSWWPLGVYSSSINHLRTPNWFYWGILNSLSKKFLSAACVTHEEGALSVAAVCHYPIFK